MPPVVYMSDSAVATDPAENPAIGPQGGAESAGPPVAPHQAGSVDVEGGPPRAAPHLLGGLRGGSRPAPLPLAPLLGLAGHVGEEGPGLHAAAGRQAEVVLWVHAEVAPHVALVRGVVGGHQQQLRPSGQAGAARPHTILRQ